MRYLINSDHVELVLKSSEPLKLLNKNDFTISTTFKPHDNTGFMKCNEIQFKNQPFGAVYSLPNSRMQFKDRNAIVLKLKNESLYRQGTFSEDLPGFLETFNLSAEAIRELHIALDSPGIISAHENLFNKKQLTRKRHVKINTYSDDKTKVLNGITLGSKKSDKHISIYNKTNELLISDKNYIVNYWQKNGLHPEVEQIDRLELRLRRPELIGLEKELQKLEDPNYLASILKSKSEKYLTFINKENKKEYSVLDWSQFEITFLKKEKRIQFHKPTQSIKICIKTLCLEHLKSNNPMTALVAKRLVEKYNLQDWFISKQSRWEKENPVFKNQVRL